MRVFPGRYGGKLEDYPKPIVRLFDDGRRRRTVELRIMRFWGIGVHYHVTLEEEHNLVRYVAEDGRVAWGVPWRDDAGTGRSFHATRRTVVEANDWALRTFRRHFKRHKLVARHGHVRWFYREGDL